MTLKTQIPGYLLLMLLLSTAKFGFAQQDPQFNQYMFNPLITNPAYAGSRDALSIVALHRSQWVGFEGAPSSQSFGIHSPLRNKNIGLGFSVISDKIGPSKSLGMFGSYCYRIRLGKGKLGFGLRTGIYNYQFDWTKIDYKDPTELDFLPERTNQWLPSFDFGLRYHSNTFYSGIAFSHLNNPSFGVDSQIDTVQYASYLASHVVFTIGNAFEINDNLVFKPSVLVKASEGQQVMVDVNASILYAKKLWFGLSVRTQYGIAIITEYNISDKLRAGYSYDFTLNKLINHNSGSHEFFIGYDLLTPKRKIMSPRYF